MRGVNVQVFSCFMSIIYLLCLTNHMNKLDLCYKMLLRTNGIIFCIKACNTTPLQRGCASRNFKPEMRDSSGSYRMGAFLMLELDR